MPQARTESTTKLSELFCDPFLRAAFARAERDSGNAFAINPPRPLNLAGGAAATAEALENV